MCTHNLCFEQEKYQNVSTENFQSLELQMQICILHGYVSIM